MKTRNCHIDVARGAGRWLEVYLRQVVREAYNLIKQTYGGKAQAKAHMAELRRGIGMTGMAWGWCTKTEARRNGKRKPRTERILGDMLWAYRWGVHREELTNACFPVRGINL